MHHVLAAQALIHAAGPGAFKIAGWKTPMLLGEILHWCARTFKILAAILILLLLYLQGKVGIPQMIIILAIGMVIIPSWSPKVSHYTANITHGSAVGSTGASAGMVILLSAMLVFTVWLTIVRRRGSEQGEEVG